MKSRILPTPKALLCLAALALTACGGSGSTTLLPIRSTSTPFRITSALPYQVLPEGVANAPYSYSFQTDAGQTNVAAILPVTFSGSQLPAGLTLSAQGVLSGTPLTAGQYHVLVTAVDSSATPVTTASSYTLNVRIPGAKLTQVGHTGLGGHGQNAAVIAAVASATQVPYAYVGTRGSPGDCPATGVKIIDLSQIANPQLVTAVGGVSGASQARPRVLTAISSPSFHPGSEGDLLAVPLRPCDPNFADANQEGIEFFDITDPRHPLPLGTWLSGVNGVGDVALLAANNHLYALAAVPNSETAQSPSPEGDLRVLDVTDPATPREIGNWGLLQAAGELAPQVVMGADQRVFLDTINLSADGKTAYLAYWDGGVAVLDVSDPTAISSGNPAIFLNHIVYPTTAAATSTTPSSPEGNTHAALPVNDGAGLMVSDEVCATGTPVNPALAVVCGPRNQTTLSADFGWGYLRTYTLSGPGSASTSGFYVTPQSVSAPAPDNGIYTAHDLAWNGDVNHPHGYVAWYSSGLVDLDLTTLAAPQLLADFVPPDTPDPNGRTPGVDNPAKAMIYGVSAFKAGGQPYVLATDINSGLWVLQETPAPSLTILTSQLPAGEVNVPYQATLSATNGALGNASGSIRFQLDPNSVNPLPPGLQLASDGLISGTPLVSGSNPVTFLAVDGLGNTTSQTINFTVDDSLAILPPAAALVGTQNEPLSLTLAAVNGVSPYTWSVVGGSLPNGLNLTPSSGAIAGTPTNAGTTTLTVQVTDSSNPAFTATLPLTIVVAPLKVRSATLANASVGVAYAQTVFMANGVGPYTPIVVGGTPPPGVAVSAGADVTAGWLISGTPTTAGTYTFSVLMSDSGGQSATQSFTLVVNPFEVTPAVLPSGQEGAGYLQQLQAQGGAKPYVFNLITGSLPAGLSLSSAGKIAGVPASGTAGHYSFRLLVTDSAGLNTTQDFTLDVFSGYSFAITTTTLPDAVAGQNYSQILAANFGAAPYTFLKSGGALPGGITLSPNGTLAGVPGAAGSYSFTVQAADANGQTATQHLDLTVLPASSPH